ncbi:MULTISPECIES: cytochrome P450 [unclassified Modestobacter]|uniref:cytochrome P450 n=1 Tax=unclassified Modestobacter TaxID=2643866 RepID=UPI0022AA4588|nr:MULTISPECIES: cytochrome P450 [unclassified Modestobacter]MCZ2826541.1 cytochrome P450 [Modestobacter sp. VKM Ac-2981]MCZ2852394.1 cytochrome P450 [Modestobacter sp. VKM Ac-2982]
MTRTASPTAGLPVSDADPFSHEVLEDPLPLHEQLREAGPVTWLSRYDVHALARYEEVHAALVDWQQFQSAAGVGLSNFRTEEPWRPPSLLLEADPPRHDAPRRVLTAVLGPRALRQLRERWAADAEELVDQVLAEGTEFDAVPALSQAFPLRVFPDAVGLGPDGRENLLPYGDHAFNAFGPPNDLVARGAPRVAELSAWVGEQCRRESLAEGGFGAAIWAAADRGDLTPQQAPLVVRSLLTAGVDTTVHGISAVLYAFATNPAQWARLRADPGLARVAFDEAIRWESPVQTFFRTTTTAVRIGETVVPEGHKVLMFLAAANRDPRRWTAPDAFDLGRDPSGHVGFGMGLHQCVGQHVARLEAESVLTALARRVARIELAGPTRRHHNNTLRAWDSLPMSVELA